jgi:hypothetical protein
MKRLVLLFALAALFACGGATTSNNDTTDAGANASAVCSSLSHSGYAVAQCIASQCCGQLTACVGDPDAVQYENCIMNCGSEGAFPADGGANCIDTCGAAHPHAASSCEPYLQCVTDACVPRH